MNTQRRIIIVGASGLVGRNLTALLQKQGDVVVPLSLRGQPLTAAQKSILENAYAVINLAGAPIAQRWTTTHQQSIFSSRVATTQHLAQALAELKARPHCFISMSGINRYGYRRPNEVLQENSAVGAEGFLTEVCQAWETATLPAAQAGIRTVLLRTGVVLAASGGALAQMLLPFKLGMGGPIGTGAQKFSWIRLGDLTALISWLLTQENIQGPINATAPKPLSQHEFARALGQALHRPSFLPLPTFMVKLIWGKMGQETLLADLAVLPQVALTHGFNFTTPTIETALPLALKE